MIPARSYSKYANQYAGASADRASEIFADSYKLALGSKVPKTATDRFHLAIEAYHQVMAASPSLMLAAVVTATADELVQKFPAYLASLQAGKPSRTWTPDELVQAAEQVAIAAAGGDQSSLEMPSGMFYEPRDEEPDPDGPLQIECMDEEILDICTGEIVDMLDTCKSMAKHLRGSDGLGAIASIQREVHSIKGAAAMSGVQPIYALCQPFEDCCDAIVNGRAAFTPAAIDAIQRAIDRLLVMTERAVARKGIGMPGVIMADLELAKGIMAT